MSYRKEKLKILVEKYHLFKTQGRLDFSSEETIRTWINELLHIFEWDVMDTSQILQEKVLSKEEREKLEKIGSSSTRPDYTFRIGNQKIAFLDAKSIAVNIETSITSAFQIKSYGWSILAPCSFLTNFEEFAIYDCTYIPNKEQNSNLGRIYLKIDDYIENFDVLESHLLKSNIAAGNLNKLYSDTLKFENSIQKITLDFAFAEQLSFFRLALAKDIFISNSELINENSELLSYLTQVIINRIIFIRICESRRIERDGLLLDFAKNGFWEEFKKSSYNQFYDHYDGPLFDRISYFQEIEIINDTISPLLELLYYPSPYRFDVIPTKLLSDIYEIFLSKKLVIENQEVSEKLKLEYIKTNGAISTPQYLVQDLLKRTILQKDLFRDGFSSFFDTKILDFACGSGIFLVETFDYLHDIMIEYYREHSDSTLKNLFFQCDDTITLTLEGKRVLISKCIFGVDIDPEAVEVARMSLSLKVIDSAEFYENYQALGVFGKQILHNVGNNIKCGNTLVPTNIIQKYPLLASDHHQFVKTNPFDYESEEGFSEVFLSKGGFDYIVGNPPYVEVKNYIREYPFMHDYLKANYITAKNGKVDLAIAFIERAVSILNHQGKLGLIVQKRFFKTDYGKKIREFISERRLLSQIIEFDTTKLFQDRITYIAILILDKSKPKEVGFLKISNEQEQVPSILRDILPFEEDKSNFTLVEPSGLNLNSWNFEDLELLRIKNRLLKSLGTFGGFAKVKVGLQVLWDRAYHIKVKAINQKEGTLSGNTHLEDNITIEIEACRPLIVNEKFYPFCSDETDTYVIFPYAATLSDNIPIDFDTFSERFPLAAQYLLRNKGRIINNVKTWDDMQQWHHFTRVQNHRAIYPKVLIPMTTKDTYATITQNPLNYCDNANMCFIDIPEKGELQLLAIAGIINSTIFSVLARSIALNQQSGYFKFNKQFIEPIPFPKYNFETNPSLVKEIAELGNKITVIQNQYKNSSPHQKNSTITMLKTLWGNLDSKVYELYNLTNEEILFFEKRGRNINRIQILNL